MPEKKSSAKRIHPHLTDESSYPLDFLSPHFRFVIPALYFFRSSRETSIKFGRPDWAALPLRLVMGSVLIVSGYGKLSHISNTVAFFAKYGFSIPVATAWFIGLLELFGERL